LSYWSQNKLRHNFGTLLDIQGKTKDHVNARYDLKDMGIRKNLHPREIDGGRVQFAKA